MGKIEADFTQISSNFDPLADGDYRFRLIEIRDQSQDPEWQAANASNGKNPALIFVSEVSEGDRIGAQMQDYIYTRTKEGKPSKMGLGKIKAYAEAILGKEEANSPNGIDTDKLVPGDFLGVVMTEKYMDTKVTPPVEKSATRLTKILPIG